MNLGNGGSRTAKIGERLRTGAALSLGFRLKVAAVCDRSVPRKAAWRAWATFKTTDWQEVVTHPDVQIVAGWWAAQSVKTSGDYRSRDSESPVGGDAAKVR